jgi:hypothetical protein
LLLVNTFIKMSLRQVYIRIENRTLVGANSGASWVDRIEPRKKLIVKTPQGELKVRHTPTQLVVVLPNVECKVSPPLVKKEKSRVARASLLDLSTDLTKLSGKISIHTDKPDSRETIVSFGWSCR